MEEELQESCGVSILLFLLYPFVLLRVRTHINSIPIAFGLKVVYRMMGPFFFIIAVGAYFYMKDLLVLHKLS